MSYIVSNLRHKPSIDIEEQIDFRDIFYEERQAIPKFFRILKQFAPFGPDNMKPIFSSSNVSVAGSTRLLKSAHLKMSVCQDDDHDIVLDAIGFIPITTQNTPYNSFLFCSYEI